MPPFEDRARQMIDQLLREAGLLVQVRKDQNLGVSRGVAVCGFALQTWFAGHILLVNRKIMGVIEVKTERNTLSGEADQSALLLTDPPPNMPHVQLSLSSASESTGVETYAPDACKPFRAASPPSTVLDDVAGSVDSQVWPSAAEEP